MSGTAGKVALVNTTVPLNGACPTGASILDLVGYGAANCSEDGHAACRRTNTTSRPAQRRGRVGHRQQRWPTSRRALAPRNPQPHRRRLQRRRRIERLDARPANNASDVPVGSNVSITFSEPVDVHGSWYLDLVRHQRRAHRDGDRRPDHVHARPGRRLRAGRELHGHGRRGAASPTRTRTTRRTRWRRTSSSASTTAERRRRRSTTSRARRTSRRTNGQIVSSVLGIVTAKALERLLDPGPEPGRRPGDLRGHLRLHLVRADRRTSATRSASAAACRSSGPAARRTAT